MTPDIIPSRRVGVYSISGRIGSPGGFLEPRFPKGIPTNEEERRERILKAINVVKPIVINEYLGNQEMEAIITERYSNPDTIARAISACDTLRKSGISARKAAEIIAGKEERVTAGLNIGSQPKINVEIDIGDMRRILVRYYSPKRK